MKGKKPLEEKYIKICPTCGSPDIEADFSNAAAVADGFFYSKRCNNCGYNGGFFPEIPVSQLKKPKNPNEIKNNQYVDKTYIKGVIGIWKVTGIIVLLFGIFLLFIPFMRTFALVFMIPLGTLSSIYGLLYKNHKNKDFMKVIMIIIILYFVLGVLISAKITLFL